jgi:mannosyltransferase
MLSAGETAPGAAAGRRGRLWSRSRVTTVAVPVAIALPVLLVLWSLVLRTRALRVSYWIDEGLSVGIASHRLAEIPGVLQQDGSPPLYYLLLHWWMRLFGTGESATHALSLAFALLCIPAALWAGWTLFGRAAGLVAATIAAFDPFLSIYADETRMYALVVLLGIITTAAFLHAFAFRRRRYVPVFAVALALLLYTHGWALFFAAGVAAAAILLLALGPDRRRIAIDGAIVVAIVAVVFAPWVPTFLFQLAHTGAPWSLGSTWRAVYTVPETLFGTRAVVVPLLGAAAFGLWLAVRSRPPAAELRALAAAVTLVAVVMLSAYLGAKVSAGWAGRYFAMFLGPLVILLAAALARARWIGLVALVVVCAQWAIPHTPPRDIKSNVRRVAARVGPDLHRGDLVVSTQPEQVPVLHHYLPAGLRFATPLGPVRDAGVMDWRDALMRLRRARPGPTLAPMLAHLPVGAHLVLVRPKISRIGWSAPWLSLVSTRTSQYLDLLANDHRFRLEQRVPRHRYGPYSMIRVRALVYVKVAES